MMLFREDLTCNEWVAVRLRSLEMAFVLSDTGIVPPPERIRSFRGTVGSLAIKHRDVVLKARADVELPAMARMPVVEPAYIALEADSNVVEMMEVTIALCEQGRPFSKGMLQSMRQICLLSQFLFGVCKRLSSDLV